MTIDKCLSDFNIYRIPLANKDIFNRLNNKQTRLTAPSIVCYITTKKDNLDRLQVNTIEKIFISDNPSIDIENDKHLLENIDEILISHSSKDLLSLSDSERNKFESQIREIINYYKRK